MSDILASIPLSAIRVFEAAARLKSFTRAAGELGITQAAVSWQVKALEQRLAQPLFRRLPREVALTPAGERLARAASEATSLLRTALNDLTETGEGLLTITALHSVATQWLAPRLGGFQLAHPKIAVRLDTTSRTVDLTREPVDLALRGGSGNWPGLESHRLFPSDGTPVCSAALAERFGGFRSPEDLLAAPRIGNEEEWAAWFEAAGVQPPKPRPGGLTLEADLQALEVASAMAGQGVALASPILFAGEIARGQLVRPFATTIAFGPGYWLAYPADRRRSPKVAAFRDWLLKVLAEDPLTAAP